MRCALLFALLTQAALAGPPGLAPRGGPRALDAGFVEEILDQEAEILAAVAEHDAQRHQALLRLKERDQRLYVHQLVRVARTLEQARDDPAFAERIRAMREHDRRLAELARQHAQASADEQARLRDEMRTVTAQLFELKQAERRARLDELAARIKELEGEITQRDKERDAIIDAYVDDKLRDSPSL